MSHQPPQLCSRAFREGVDNGLIQVRAAKAEGRAARFGGSHHFSITEAKIPNTCIKVNLYAITITARIWVDGVVFDLWIFGGDVAVKSCFK